MAHPVSWGHETRFTASRYPDADDQDMTGVAFITDQGLQEENLSREEGEVMLRNEILMLEQYINGNVYLLRIKLDGETEYHGQIYAVTESGETTGKIAPIVDCYVPPDSLLDEYMLESAASEEDRALVATKKWK